MANFIGRGNAHVGKIDAILTDSNLDPINRIIICILMNAIAPKLEYAGEVWESNTKLRSIAVNSTNDNNQKSANIKMLRYDEQYSTKSRTRNVPTQRK